MALMHRIRRRHAGTPASLSGQVDSMLDILPLGTMLAANAVCTGLLILMGSIYNLTGRLGNTMNIDADAEFAWPLWRTRIALPALLSALVLLVAGWLWWKLGALLPRAAAWGSRLLAVFLCYMGADEFLAIHERTGAAWQTYFLPPVALMALVCLGLLWVLLRRGIVLAVVTFCAGGLCWVASQSLERWVEFDATGAKVASYWTDVYFEESLEIFGSGLFAIAAILAIQSLRRRAA